MPTAVKVKKVEEIKELFDKANSFFITDYQGLNVSDMTVLRKALRNSEVTYLIAKNTLFKLALDGSGFENLKDHFSGPTAVAFTSADPVAAAKILNESYKDKELPRMKAFVVDKDSFGAGDIGRLADLPSREILLAQLVSTIEAPLTNLVMLLDGIFNELIGTIEALAEKKKAG